MYILYRHAHNMQNIRHLLQKLTNF